MLVELLGIVATVICTFTQMSLMILCFKDRDSASGVVSLSTCFLVIISSSLWLGYGIMAPSFSVSLQAVAGMMSTLAIIFLLYDRKIFAGAVAIIASIACIDVIGGEQFVGNVALVASMLMFVPFALKSTRSVSAAMEVPNSTMLCLLCGNVLWVAYGLILHQIPVAISSLLPALCGAAIGVLKMYGASRKKVA